MCWHVDYWDRLGWPDPFGSKDYSARQRQYRKVKQLKTMGTPQFFIDNEALPWVRGAHQRIPGLVDAGAKQPPKLRIDVTPKLDGKKVVLSIKLQQLGPELKLGKNVKVVPVLWQRKAVTPCNAGENRGKTLTEYYIVRKVGTALSVKKALDKGVTASLDLPVGVKPSDVGYAVLVEDSVTLRTWECVSASIAK